MWTQSPLVQHTAASPTFPYFSLDLDLPSLFLPLECVLWQRKVMFLESLIEDCQLWVVCMLFFFACLLDIHLKILPIFCLDMRRLCDKVRHLLEKVKLIMAENTEPCAVSNKCSASRCEGKAEVFLPSTVFYNPVQEFNRYGACFHLVFQLCFKK